MSKLGAADVLTFWFDEIQPAQWWRKDPTFDEQIRQRFATLHQQAAANQLSAWRQTISGRLAEIIVLDQFSRNLFRDQAQAFTCDAQATQLTLAALEISQPEQLTAIQRSFLYMPLMHSESLELHELALSLYAANGLADNLEFEKKHYAIIARFGRYPHRNALLGRPSTPEEQAFLQQPGSSF